MEEKKRKRQKVFAIVNVSVGVVFAGTGGILLNDPSVGPGGIILAGLGTAVLLIGSYMLRTLKKHIEDEERVRKASIGNTVAFVFSALVMAACIMLPIIASLVG